MKTAEFYTCRPGDDKPVWCFLVSQRLNNKIKKATVVILLSLSALFDSCVSEKLLNFECWMCGRKDVLRKRHRELSKTVQGKLPCNICGTEQCQKTNLPLVSFKTQHRNVWTAIGASLPFFSNWINTNNAWKHYLWVEQVSMHAKYYLWWGILNIVW